MKTSHSHTLHLYKALKSPHRIQILQKMDTQQKALRFNEIQSLTKIPPTKLEYHLQILKQNNLLTHKNKHYSINLLTQSILLDMQKYQNQQTIDYFSQHYFPIANSNLFRQFRHQKIQIFSDIFEMIQYLKNLDKIHFKICKIVGNMNFELEAKAIGTAFHPFFEKLKIDKTVIISTEKKFKELAQFDEKSIFFDTFPSEVIKFYQIKSCNLYIGILDSAGLLFLPTLEGGIDFNQGLLFNDQEGLLFLENIIKYLLLNSKELSSQEINKILKPRHL